MYIIISHDVDHLYTIEHWKKDLILEKYVARACMEMIKGRISFKTCLHRLFAPFQYRFCRIPEIVEYDIQHNIPSSFFFGMGNSLGMSYSINQAIPWIQFVLEKGFDVGVHAADISSPTSIQREHDAFKEICPNKTFGTRVHYVRYSDDTFQSLATAGYLFDTTEFSKESFSLKQPYVITAPNGNRMWEFPLNLMDGYVLEECRNYYNKLLTMELTSSPSFSMIFISMKKLTPTGLPSTNGLLRPVRKKVISSSLTTKL